MFTLLAAFFTAFVIALLATPAMRHLALRSGAVSVPGGRNINAQVIPRLGGVAIACAAVAPIALLFLIDSSVAHRIRGQGLLVAGLGFGAIAMCAVGARDDLKGLRAVTKLIAQVICATLAYYAGFQIQVISLPFVGLLDMGVFALPVTVIWIIGITNAVNLIDGLDGLAAGVVFCAAGTNLVVAVVTGNIFVALIMASLMGALIGFLFYNFNPARIFMGDSGSYFLGFVLATASLAGNQKASTAVALLAPVLALGIPIFDTLFSIVRRALQRRPIFSPDRGHLHHLLLDVGLTHRRAVLTLYVLSLLFAAAGVGVSIGRDWQTGLAVLGATVLIVGLVVFIRAFDRAHAHVPHRCDDLSAALLRNLPSFIRSWQDTPSLDSANLQLARLRSLPNVQDLHFVESSPGAARQHGTILINGTTGLWSLRVRCSTGVSHEARALLRMIVHTAEPALQPVPVRAEEPQRLPSNPRNAAPIFLRF